MMQQKTAAHHVFDASRPNHQHVCVRKSLTQQRKSHSHRLHFQPLASAHSREKTMQCSIFATANQSARRPSICLVHAREQAGIIRADISARHDWASSPRLSFCSPKMQTRRWAMRPLCGDGEDGCVLYTFGRVFFQLSCLVSLIS